MSNIAEKLNASDIAEAEAIKLFMKMFQGSNDHNRRELKALSILGQNEYLEPFLKKYIEGKRDVKRRFRKDLLKLGNHLFGKLFKDKLLKLRKKDRSIW